MFTGFSLALPCGADLLGSIAGVHFVENIADSGKLILAPGAVYAVIDGDKMYAVLRENNIRIHTHLQIVAPESAHVLYDDALDFASLNIGKHTLEARTVEIRSRIAVILVIVPDSGIPVIFAVAFQNLFLRQDLSRVVSAKMIFSKNSKCDFVTESASETGYTTNTKHKEAFL